MTQLQFEMICKIIETGAPALAEELCNSLNDLVVERNNLAQEVEVLKSGEKVEEAIVEASES